MLEHDLFAQTVDIATGYILPAALANQPKFDIKPVISCLNKPMGDSYLETNDNKTNPLPTGTASSTYFIQSHSALSLSIFLISFNVVFSPLLVLIIHYLVPTDPAPVAFSSGAAGSAQATGGANSSSSGGNSSGSGSGSGGAAKPSGASINSVSNVLALAGSAIAVVVAGFTML